MSKKILISGVNGFIGHNIADFLVEKGFQIWGTYRNNVLYYNPKINYIKCDLSIPIQMQEEFDIVIHLASQIENSITYDYITNTVTSTKNIVDYCERTNISFLIYMSSIAVYGETDVEVDEYSDKRNTNIYGMSKLLSESIIKESNIESRIILRLPRVLGEGVNINHQWLPALSYKLLQNQDITYFNSQLQYNNLMDVDDLSLFCNSLIEKFYGQKIDEIFLLGTLEKMKIIEIIEYIKEILKSNSRLISSTDRKSTVFSVNISKAKQFGYNPKHIKKVIESFVHYVQTIKE